MKSQTAHEFLTRCFAPAEAVAILLRKEQPASTAQRIVRLERALSSRYLGKRVEFPFGVGMALS